EEVVCVAREGEEVALAPAALERMGDARAVVEGVVERGDPVSGGTTGVAPRKRVAVAADEVADFNRRLLRSHRVGQGPEVTPEVVRASLVRLANGFAPRTPRGGPEPGGRVVGGVNEGGA